MATTAKSSTETTKKTAAKTTKKAAATTAAKPAAKKAPAKTPAAAKATAKPAATKKTAKAAKPAVGAAQRRNYIEVAAYYIAERRNFVGGNAADDWKAAEAEIDRLLSEGKLHG